MDKTLKKCSKCLIEKDLNSFYVGKVKRARDVVYKPMSQCKSCQSEYCKFYSKTAKGKENARKRQIKYLSSEKGHAKSYEARKKYRSRTKEKRNEYAKVYRLKRKKTDINYRLACNLRSRTANALKRNYKEGSSISDLGCSLEQLKLHLESLFQPGMTWDNWAVDGWHIDHIIPLSSFDLTNREEFLKAVHYTNLQPMWSVDNLQKGSKL